MRAGSRRSKSAGARMRSSARQIGTRKRAGRSAWPSKQRCSRLLRRRSGECLRSVAALPAGTRRRRPASPRPQRRRQLRRRGRRRRCRNALPRRGAKRKPRRGCKKLLEISSYTSVLSRRSSPSMLDILSSFASCWFSCSFRRANGSCSSAVTVLVFAENVDFVLDHLSMPTNACTSCTRLRFSWPV